MLVKEISKELDAYKYWKVILNLTETSWEHTDDTVESFLEGKDKIPYECYEKIYDWDEYGSGDGHDVICFYSKSPGLLERNEKARKAYGENV